MNKITERFSFSYSFGDYDERDHLENRLEFNGDGMTITELLPKIEQFLRGNGFYFDGELSIVDYDLYDLVERKTYSEPSPEFVNEFRKSNVTVTKDMEQGINITNDGNIYPAGQEKRSPDRGPYSAYPIEAEDAWAKET